MLNQGECICVKWGENSVQSDAQLCAFLSTSAVSSASVGCVCEAWLSCSCIDKPNYCCAEPLLGCVSWN